MKKLGFFFLFLFLIPFLGCEKSAISENKAETEIYNDEANTEEIPAPDDTEGDEDEPVYNPESGPRVTKIVSINGLRVSNTATFDGCTNTFKYADRFIISTEPRVLTVILDRPDTIRSVVNASYDTQDNVELTDLQQTAPNTIRFNIRAIHDTVQTKTVNIGLISGISLGQLGYPSLKKKIKCVGVLKDENGLAHPYGSNKWMELYWLKFRNKTVTAQTPIRITSDWIPQYGDVLMWLDGHTATIIKQPTSVMRTVGGVTYRQNRFHISSMNVRCRSEKTIKYMWHKSNDENTLRGANKDRGAAKYYYRYQ